MCIKLKKTLSLFLSTIICLFFTACNYNFLEIFKPKNYTTVFYGVIAYEEFHNGLCVNIPNVGLCTIPKSENVYSMLNETTDYSYLLQCGDLIELTFNHEHKDLAIMESYPGQFSLPATSIVVYAQNVSFEYLQSIDNTDASWKFTQNRTDIFKTSQVGDFVYFIENGGKNGVAYKKLFASAQIGELNEEKISFYFNNDIKIEEFLKNYSRLEQSTDWNVD